MSRPGQSVACEPESRTREEQTEPTPQTQGHREELKRRPSEHSRALLQAPLLLGTQTPKGMRSGKDGVSSPPTLLSGILPIWSPKSARASLGYPPNLCWFSSQKAEAIPAFSSVSPRRQHLNPNDVPAQIFHTGLPLNSGIQGSPEGGSVTGTGLLHHGCLSHPQGSKIFTVNLGTRERNAAQPPGPALRPSLCLPGF